MPQLAVLLSTLIWGATFPATKAALEQIPPFSFLFLRFLLGLLLTVAVLLVLSRWRLRSDRATLQAGLVASLFWTAGYVLQTLGLQHTSASNSAFITVLYVVLVPLFLRRFGGMIWLSAGLALGGLWLLVEPSASMNLGDLLTLGCAAAFAGHICCLESYTRRVEPIPLFLWQMIAITGATGLAMLVEAPGAAQLAPTPVLLAALAVTGLLATGAFAVQIWAQRLISAQRIALFFSLEPAFAAWLAWYFLGEHLSSKAWIGSGLILVAMLVGGMRSTGPGEAGATVASPAH
ncbi:MAG: DMT family transporter [Nitrospirota bacterium]